MCFSCLSDSWNDISQDWKPRENPTVRRFNLKHTPLVNPENILLPPLHIKLGLMKTFVKAMNHDGAAFLYLKAKFQLFQKQSQTERRSVFWDGNSKTAAR